MAKDGQSEICEIRLDHKQRRNALSHSNECADRNTNDINRENVNRNIATGPRPVHFFLLKKKSNKKEKKL